MVGRREFRLKACESDELRSLKVGLVRALMVLKGIDMDIIKLNSHRISYSGPIGLYRLVVGRGYITEPCSGGRVNLAGKVGMP